MGNYISDRESLMGILTDEKLPQLEKLGLFRRYYRPPALSWQSTEDLKNFCDRIPRSLKGLSAEGLSLPEPLEVDASKTGPCISHPLLDVVRVDYRIRRPPVLSELRGTSEDCSNAKIST